MVYVCVCVCECMYPKLPLHTVIGPIELRVQPINHKLT